MPKHESTVVKKSAVDVPADNPVGTMDRFTKGLRRVLSVQKSTITPKPRTRKPAKRH